MLNTDDAVTILRNLRAYQSCRLMDGTPAIVMAQLRERVTVLVGAVVLVVNRWELEPIATVEFSEEDLAWFRRPAKEAA